MPGLQGDEDFGAQWLLCTTCEGWFHYHCALKEVKQRPKTANAKIYKFSVYENAKRGVEYTCTGCLHGAQVLQAFGGANDAESDENGTDAGEALGAFEKGFGAVPCITFGIAASPSCFPQQMGPSTARI